MATDLTKFYRNSSQDLVWNSSTNRYESDSTPATSGYLTDGSGNVLMINGKVIYVTLETPYNLTFSISGSKVPAPTVTVINGNNSISVLDGDVITVSGECTINGVSNAGDWTIININNGAFHYGNYGSVSHTFTPDSDCSIRVVTTDK